MPAEYRADLLGELDEEYSRFVCQERRPSAARLWYWRQVLGSVRFALMMRRGRPGRRGGSDTSHAWTDQAIQDVRLAVRGLGRRPGFAIAAILTFALGIGANTAIFSVVDFVLLRPLAYRDPGALVRIWSSNPRGIQRNSLSPADFFAFQERARNFEGLAAFSEDDSFTVQLAGQPLRVRGATVTPSLFDVLKVSPSIGMTGMAFGPDDPTTAAGVILSDRFWRQHLGADPSVLGRMMSLNEVPHTVVAIMPAGFSFPSPAVDLWVRLADSTRAEHSARYLQAVGRLAPGIGLQAGREALLTVARQLESEQPDFDRGWSVTASGFSDSLVGGVRQPLLLLLAAVACVLLIACANVSNLFLARGIARERELALRTALGASRGALVRQQIVESTMIAVLGGVAGVLAAGWSLAALRAAKLDLPRIDTIALDSRVLGFSLAISVLAGLVSGLVPGLRWRSIDARAIVQAARDGASGPGRQRARSLLIVVETALTLMLMVNAGLLINSFVRLSHVESGFAADRVLVGQLNLPSPRYGRDARAPFFDRVLQEVRSLPGVETAGAGGPLPLSGEEGLYRFGVLIDGEADRGSDARTYLRWATPDYFAAIGIPLLAGRSFSAHDDARSRPVAVVDQAFVRKYLGVDPIGRRVRSTNDRTWRDVIGVVGAVRQTSLDREAEPHLYVAQAQLPSPALSLVVRASVEPGTLSAAMADRVHAVDPALPLFNVRTLKEVVDASKAPRRFNAFAVTLFSALAALLTCVGIYGVIAHWVSESTREIGIRIALGASRGDIFSLIVGRSLRLTSAGIVVGLLMAFWSGRLVAGLLYGVQALDPLTYAAASGLVIAVALLASYLPARGATSLNPVESLRSS